MTISTTKCQPWKGCKALWTFQTGHAILLESLFFVFLLFFHFCLDRMWWQGSSHHTLGHRTMYSAWVVKEKGEVQVTPVRGLAGAALPRPPRLVGGSLNHYCPEILLLLIKLYYGWYSWQLKKSLETLGNNSVMCSRKENKMIRENIDCDSSSRCVRLRKTWPGCLCPVCVVPRKRYSHISCVVLSLF